MKAMTQSQIYRQENTAILSNHNDEGIAIIYSSPDKKLQHSNKRTSWKKSNGSEKAKNSAACCRQGYEYPPGYTVFECRLDGNQPIAQVVQVPSDTTDNVIQNKTCMLLETKQSEFGPSSRVVAYPARGTSCRKNSVVEPMSFALETRDCPGGAVACAEKVSERMDQRSAMCSTQPVTILETTKGPTCRNGPSSRLVYGPVTQEVAKSSRASETPGLYIQCTTTREGPIARVTQVPRELSSISGDPGTNYEAFVKHDGSCPTAVVTRCNKKKEIAQSACELLETRVDASGPRARALTLPEGSSNFRHFTHLDVRPQENGPSARISQHPGQPQEIISNLLNKQVNPSNSCCNYQANPVTCAASPPKSARTFRIKQAGCKPMSNIGRRNGLSPRHSELQEHTGSFKNSRIKRGRFDEATKSCPIQCSRPVSSPAPNSPICRLQPAPCASKTSSISAKRPTSAFLRPGTCLCPVQQQCKILDHPFSEMRPLPGGTVVTQCPPPSLPEISPVPIGSNRLRDYKPRPKTSRPQNTSSPSSLRPKQPPKVDVKSKKSDESVAKKKSTKNRKTGSSGKHRKAPKITDENKDEILTPVSEKTYVECPAFASKGIQSVRVCEKPSNVECPTFETKGVQSTRICKKPSYVECPAFQSKGIQSVRTYEKQSYVECPAFETKGIQSARVCEKPSYVECPAFQTKGIQSARVCEKPSYVECPAFQSKGIQSVRICEKPSYIDCPTFQSKGNQSNIVHEEPSYIKQLERNKSVCRLEKSEYIKCPAFTPMQSSETSLVYLPRDDVSVNKYSEYFRPKTLGTSFAYCTKRNRLQDNCRLHIPESVLRINYEQRRNRHARVLLSSGSRRRRFDDEVNEIGREYCDLSSKYRKKDHHKEAQRYQHAIPLMDKKEEIKEIEKPKKSALHDLPKKRKLSLKAVKSRELRAGVVYYDCDCYHRNGLQHDCPRGGCGGLKHCATKPWPNCDMSRYFKDKWGKYHRILDLIPPTTYCGPRDALYRAKIVQSNDPKAQGKDEKLEKPQEDLAKIKRKSTKKVEKNVCKFKEKEIQRKYSDECHKIHENMVQRYAIIPVTVDQCYHAA